MALSQLSQLVPRAAWDKQVFGGEQLTSFFTGKNVCF